MKMLAGIVAAARGSEFPSAWGVQRMVKGDTTVYRAEKQPAPLSYRANAGKLIFGLSGSKWRGLESTFGVKLIVATFWDQRAPMAFVNFAIVADLFDDLVGEVGLDAQLIAER